MAADAKAAIFKIIRFINVMVIRVGWLICFRPLSYEFLSIIANAPMSDFFTNFEGRIQKRIIEYGIIYSPTLAISP